MKHKPLVFRFFLKRFATFWEYCFFFQKTVTGNAKVKATAYLSTSCWANVIFFYSFAEHWSDKQVLRGKIFLRPVLLEGNCFSCSWQNRSTYLPFNKLSGLLALSLNAARIAEVGHTESKIIWLFIPFQCCAVGNCGSGEYFMAETTSLQETVCDNLISRFWKAGILRPQMFAILLQAMHIMMFTISCAIRNSVSKREM